MFAKSDKRVAKEEAASANNKTLIIVRGIPGSGKTSTVLDVFLGHPNLGQVGVCSADFHFYNQKGEYHWVKPELGKAHELCENTCHAYMAQGKNTIVIANTNIKRADYKKYLLLAKQYGYEAVQYVMQTQHQSIHDVPQDTILRMQHDFEDDSRLRRVNDDLDFPQRASHIKPRSKAEMTQAEYELAKTAKLDSNQFLQKAAGTRAAQAPSYDGRRHGHFSRHQHASRSQEQEKVATDLAGEFRRLSTKRS